MDKSHWIKNRNSLLHSMPNNIAAILIVGNAVVSRNSDTSFAFRQDSNVIYTSGITKPGVALLYIVSSANWYVVQPKISKVEKIFDDNEDWDSVALYAGMHSCIDITEAIPLLQKAANNGDIYTNMAPPNKIHGVYSNPLRAEWHRRLRQKGVDIKDVRPYLARLRMIKQPYEIQLLQHAVSETKDILSEVENRANLIDGLTERQLANQLTAKVYEKNLEHAYQPIIASGANAAVLHHLPDNSVISKNTVVLFDVGLEHYGYAADISRTIIHGNNAECEKIIIDLEHMQKALIESLCPGVTWKQLHQQAEQLLTNVAKKHDLLKDATMRHLFPHAIGHFLGLDVHDVGDYSVPLQENMVITVEPGIYSKRLGFGIRIEDDIVITKTGAKIL